MRKSISCRASTASEVQRSGATRFCTARVRSLYTSAEKRARLMTNRGFAARQTSKTCNAQTERQGVATCQRVMLLPTAEVIRLSWTAYLHRAQYMSASEHARLLGMWPG